MWKVDNKHVTYLYFIKIILYKSPQWGAADAEIKVPSDENTELKGSPFKDPKHTRD